MSQPSPTQSRPVQSHRLWGFSMWPAILPGQRVVVDSRYTFASLREGDIIAFRHRSDQRKPTVHRVIGEQIINGDLVYRTKGDHNRFADQGFVGSDDYVGKVTHIGGHRV